MVIQRRPTCAVQGHHCPGLRQFYREGWLEVTVGETTSFDRTQGYIEASRNGLGQALHWG